MWKTIIKLFSAFAILTIILYSICVVCVFVTRSSLEPYDSRDNTTWYNHNNVIFEWEVYKLHNVMTEIDIYNALGRPRYNVGSGNMVFEYICFNGGYLYVTENGKCFFESEQWQMFEGIELKPGPAVAPVVWCFVASAVIVLGGYLVIAYRKRKVAARTAADAKSDTAVLQEDT